MNRANPVPTETADLLTTPKSPDPAGPMLAILQRQRKAFTEQLPVSVADRLDRLNRMAELLLRHGDDLAQAMDADFGGRPTLMSRLVDVSASVGAIRYAKQNLKRWMRNERRPVRFPLNLLGARARIEYQPLGVVGIISPWNYPVNLAFSPMADAIAAGNRVMLKPSEYTPATSALMATLLAEAFDETEIAVVLGGPETASAFSALPFDHLLFTGSTAIGRLVMRAAAENLVPVTLELGGKCPAIIADDADLDETAERLVAGKLLNAGQTCLAPDYLLVPRSKLNALVDSLKVSAARLFPGGADNKDLTAVIDERQYQRLDRYLAEARDAGVAVIETAPADPARRRRPLTLVVEPGAHLDVMREEIFGPILPVIGYDTLDEAIAYVNGLPRPLGLYVFGDDQNAKRTVLDRTIAGGVTLDDVLFHVSAEALPFGGVGASGIGAYHGQQGFRTFSHAKSVYKPPPPWVLRLLGLTPPFGKRLERLLKMELRG